MTKKWIRSLMGKAMKSYLLRERILSLYFIQVEQLANLKVSIDHMEGSLLLITML